MSSNSIRFPCLGEWCLKTARASRESERGQMRLCKGCYLVFKLLEREMEMNKLKKTARLRNLRELIVSRELGAMESQDRRRGMIPENDQWLPTPGQHERAQRTADQEVGRFKLGL